MEIEKWKQYVKGFSWRSLRKDQLLILLLTGILLVIIAVPAGTAKNEETQQQETEKISSGDEDYVQYMETRLEKILAEISDVGEVEVMITLESSAEKVVEKDRSSQQERVTESAGEDESRISENTTSSETSVYEQSDGTGDTPYVSKEISPRVQGVLVVAEGGDLALVKQNITEAVQALFDIDTHKIRIMKKNHQSQKQEDGQ